LLVGHVGNVPHVIQQILEMQPPSQSVPKPPRREVAERPISPARPERPSPPTAHQSPTSGCLGLVLAGMGAIFIVACLVMLSSGLLAYALLAGGAFFAYAFFHYAVWGWWLSDRIRRDVQDEEAAPSNVGMTNVEARIMKERISKHERRTGTRPFGHSSFSARKAMPGGMLAHSRRQQ
jgi:hypothetical protein